MAPWASALFASALHAVAGFTSPRAWAFTLLGLADYCLAHPRDHAAMHIRLDLGERLHQRLLACETDDWVWFEDRLTYDNARLCEALITGKAIGRDDWTQAGLRACVG
jgi:hypothetical protein